jgi:membrane protein
MKHESAHPDDFADYHHAQAHHAQAGHPGRDAESPHQIPARGWLAVLKRTAAEINHDHLPLISAGVGFFFLLGLFPALAAVVSIYGWLADPATVTGHLAQLAQVLPAEAAAIIGSQAEKLAARPSSAGWGALLGVFLALWAGSKAMKGMVDALNIAYKQDEARGLIKKQATYLGLTFLAVLAGVLSILLIAVAPVVVGFLPLPEWGRQAVVWLRWPVLLMLGMTAIAAIYRYGPSRRQAKWRWISWGAAAATLLWLAASALFSLYVSSFGNFNETYGSLGAVIVLMLWLYLTAFFILMGAELDAELEHQTARDTTVGQARPIGTRGAHVADHLADEE